VGWFSDSTEKYVQVSNSKLFDPEDFPNTLRDAISTAIFGNEDIVTHLQLASLTNFSAKGRSYLNYGENKYYRGLPTSTSSFYDVDDQAVIDVIEAIEGGPITLLTASIVTVVQDYEGYEYLQDTYGWSEKVNELTEGGTVYNLRGVDYYFKESCDDEENPECSTPPARFKFRLEEKLNPGNFYDLYVDHSEGYGQRYNISYHLDSNPADDVVYWTYIISEGTYPTLDAPPPFAIDGTFYPIAVIRNGWRNVNKIPGSNEAIQTTRLLDKIQLDLDLLTDAIMENPNAADVYSAFITLSLDMSTEVPESIFYLYKFFRELSFVSTITKEAYESGSGGWFWYGNNFTVHEATFNKQISYSYVDLITVNAVFGNVGDVQKEKTDSNDWIIKHQISETHYEQLEIKNLTSQTVIAGEYEWTDTVLIPLKFETLQELNNLNEEIVLLDSLHLCIYAYHEEEVAWYVNNPFFDFLLIVAAIAITIYSAGTATTLFKAIALAIGTGNYVIAVLLIGKIFLAIAINYAILWIAGELTGIGRIIFLVLAYFYLPINLGGAGGSVQGLPFAEAALRFTSSILQVEVEDIQVELKELQYETEEFDAELQSRQEELETARDLLGSENYAFDPLFILDIGIYYVPNESPEGFYERTLNFDPGSITLEAVDLYVDAALKLPETNQGFGNLLGNINEQGSTDWFTA